MLFSSSDCNKKYNVVFVMAHVAANPYLLYVLIFYMCDWSVEECVLNYVMQIINKWIFPHFSLYAYVLCNKKRKNDFSFFLLLNKTFTYKTKFVCAKIIISRRNYIFSSQFYAILPTHIFGAISDHKPSSIVFSLLCLNLWGSANFLDQIAISHLLK
jgi:hypothetical protein